jgi:hypothetical protein
MNTKTTTSKKNRVYEPVSRLPVAKFYYQGNHSHPVRRTVLIVEENKDQIRGYELREGRTTRSLGEIGKCIKSYRKDKIARWGDYSRLLKAGKAKKKSANTSTLERFSITGMFTE